MLGADSQPTVFATLSHFTWPQFHLLQGDTNKPLAVVAVAFDLILGTVVTHTKEEMVWSGEQQSKCTPCIDSCLFARVNLCPLFMEQVGTFVPKLHQKLRERWRWRTWRACASMCGPSNRMPDRACANVGYQHGRSPRMSEHVRPLKKSHCSRH